MVCWRLNREAFEFNFRGFVLCCFVCLLACLFCCCLFWFALLLLLVVVVVVVGWLVFLFVWFLVLLCSLDRLAGLVVRRPPRERKILGSNPACAWIFSGSSHTSDSKIGTPVATLPGAWRYRVSAGTGRTGVSILWLGEMESLICNFYLSVAARQIVWAYPSLRYTSMLLGR